MRVTCRNTLPAWARDALPCLALCLAVGSLVTVAGYADVAAYDPVGSTYDTPGVALSPYEVQAEVRRLMSLAEAAHKKGNTHLAYTYMLRVVDVVPNSAAAWSNIGGFLADQPGRLAEAEEAYLKSIAADPMFATTHYNLGVLLQQKGGLNLDRAERHLRKAIELNPEYREAYNSLCAVERARVPVVPNKVLACYRAAVKKFPTYSLALNNLGSTLSDHQKDDKEAIKYFKKATKADPKYASAWKNLGTSYKRLKKWNKALKALKKSLELAPLRPSVIEMLGEVLMELGRVDERERLYQTALDAGIWQTKDQYPLTYIPALEAKPWWDIQSFGWSSFLLESYPVIRQEAMAALDSFETSFTNYSSRAIGAGEWWELVLWENGKRQQRECKLAPRTCAIFDEIPEATSCVSGNIYISVLTPGAALKPHFGPTNARLRCHLGLKVPDKCSIRVGNTTNTWADGKLFIFDDSYEHEVSNNSDERRMVLIFDVWHPQLTTTELRLQAADWPTLP